MNYPDMKIMAESFSFVHINAPGQEPGAKTLPEGYVWSPFGLWPALHVHWVIARHSVNARVIIISCISSSVLLNVFALIYYIIEVGMSQLGWTQNDLAVEVPGGRPQDPPEPLGYASIEAEGRATTTRCP